MDDVRQRIETLTAERGPLYESVAHLAITVDRRPPKAIATDTLRPAHERRRNRQRRNHRKRRPVHVVNDRIDVTLPGERSYPILLGNGLLGTPDLLEPYTGNQALVVTNAAVAGLYLPPERNEAW